MSNIRHLLTIKAPAEKIFKAITTEVGLSNWWTTAVQATPKEGAELEFGFDRGYSKKFEVKDIMP